LMVRWIWYDDCIKDERSYEMVLSGSDTRHRVPIRFGIRQLPLKGLEIMVTKWSEMKRHSVMTNEVKKMVLSESDTRHRVPIRCGIRQLTLK
jgi:hypothetical protein